jgi:hypothetical protein
VKPEDGVVVVATVAVFDVLSLSLHVVSSVVVLGCDKSVDENPAGSTVSEESCNEEKERTSFFQSVFVADLPRTYRCREDENIRRRGNRRCPLAIVVVVVAAAAELVALNTALLNMIIFVCICMRVFL